MEDDAPPGVPEWVVTYGDMMSLLLTFFIMLVSMSQLKEEGRVTSALDSLREVFGPDEMMNSGVPGRSPLTTSNVPFKFSKGVRSERDTKKASKQTDGKSGDSDPVDDLREGKRITLGGPALFDRFSADPTDELNAVLDQLAEVMDHSRKQIAVRGHASPEPLPAGTTPFADHQELAFERAARVAERLIERGVSPSRLILSSAGSAEPRLRTRDPQRQRLNDRVDVFLVDSYAVVP